jgi:hypothetical protein
LFDPDREKPYRQKQSAEHFPCGRSKDQRVKIKAACGDRRCAAALRMLPLPTPAGDYRRLAEELVKLHLAPAAEIALVISGKMRY